MSDKQRILFVCSSLGGGGAERVAVLLLEYLDREKFQPCLVLFEDKVDYAVPEDVPVIFLHKRGWYDLPKLIWRLSQVYRKSRPNVVLSFLTYTNIIAVLSRKPSRVKFKLLLSEHGMLSILSRNVENPLWLLFKKWIPRWIYPTSDKVICVSQALSNVVCTQYKMPPEKVIVIYNPIDIKSISALAQEEVDHYWFVEKKVPIIISVGSLSRTKGYSYLLRAFAQVLAKLPSHLVILGKGKEEQALEALTRELGIEDRVAFLGFQTNPFKYLVRSDLAVYPSLGEAFPMVLLEALSCQIPIISTRNPGAIEIITDGINGFLVPMADEFELAKAMLQLLTDRHFAAKLARAGRERVEGFNVEKVVREYEELFVC